MATLKNVSQLSKKLLVRNTPHINITRKYEKITTTPSEEVVRIKLVPSQSKYLPALYPKTEEEWKASAEKYNMHPDEYKPYPNDHRYTGDYPELPMLSIETRDVYYPWDFPSYRRNFGEPIHKQFDILGLNSYAFGVREMYSGTHTLVFCICFLLGCLLLGAVSGSTSQPVMEKQYPGKGVHYTFELK